MKQKLIVIFLVILSYSLPAQLIEPAAENQFDKFPNFNAEVVKRNKIKTITFDILDKKDMEAPKDNGIMNYYEFDTLGRLIRFYYTTISKIIVKEYHSPAKYKKRRKISDGVVYYKNENVFDTISTRFFYNEQGKIKMKRFNDGTYYEAVYYEYNEDGFVTRQLRCRETNTSSDKSVFVMGIQTVLSEEKFTYEKIGPHQYKKKCLNDEGRPFKEVIVNLNADKQPVKYNESFTATWVNQVTEFVYGSNTRMTERKYSGNSNGDLTLRQLYEYDENGYLYSEKQFKNEVLQNELSYITDASNGLLKSYADRDHVNKSIRITKLYFKFY